MSGKVRFYFPLSTSERFGTAPTLCRTFARLRQSDPDAILAFANKYGALTNDMTLLVDMAEPMAGEGLDDWSAAAKAVRDALWLLDAARAPSPAKLHDAIWWKKDLAPVVLPSGRREELRATKDRRRYLEAAYHLEPGDFRRAARFAAQRLINEGLDLENATNARLFWNQDREALELRVAANSLIGVLWVQVARVAEGAVEHHACSAPGCEEWFVSQRSDKRTCSLACQKRLQRAMKKAAPKRRRRA
jgi:hypothetical protein